MRDSLLTRMILGLLLPMTTGCHALSPTPTIPVLVVDAESKTPIPNADVQFWSPSDNTRGSHEEPSGTTGPDGIARIKAEFSKEADIYIHVSANGYLPDGVDRVMAGRLPGAPPGGAIVEMFSGPRPVVELVVPSDFRGDLKVEVKIPEGAAVEPGKRVFRYAVPSLVGQESFLTTPVVHVEGSPLFERGMGPEFRGIYASGSPMPAEPKDTEVVLRWVRSEGADQYFVVGTKVDQESARKAAEKTIGPRESNIKKSSGGGNGGGGRRMGGGGGGGMGSPAGY